MLVEIDSEFGGAVHDVVAIDGARKGLVLHFLFHSCDVHFANAAAWLDVADGGEEAREFVAGKQGFLHASEARRIFKAGVREDGAADFVGDSAFGEDRLAFARMIGEDRMELPIEVMQKAGEAPGFLVFGKVAGVGAHAGFDGEAVAAEAFRFGEFGEEVESSWTVHRVVLYLDCSDVAAGEIDGRDFETQHSGPVAQLGARFHGMEEVKGSNPFRSTNFFWARGSKKTGFRADSPDPRAVTPEGGNASRGRGILQLHKMPVPPHQSFRRQQVATIPSGIGVYVLCDLDEVPIYVGKSTDGVQNRVRRHLTSARSDTIANRQLDVWEVAFVWSYPCATKAVIPQLEAFLFHQHDPKSPLMNGAIPQQPVQPTFQLPERIRVQVLPDEERAIRRDPARRLPRQSQFYFQLVDHILNVKDTRQLRRSLQAHFDRLRRYHSHFTGNVLEAPSEDEEDQD